MASRRILPDRVTIHNYVGEVDDAATYQATIIEHCYCPLTEGLEADGRGKRASDRTTLYIFDRASSAHDSEGNPRTYLAYNLWKLLSPEDKKNFWTIGDTGKDFVQKPGHVEKLYFQSFAHHTNGSKRVWHFEVHFR